MKSKFNCKFSISANVQQTELIWVLTEYLRNKKKSLLIRN